MKLQSNKARAESEGTCAPKARRGLFRKYVMLFVTVVCGALVTSGLFDVWFSFREQEALLVRIQRGQAESAAAKISQYIQQIVAQLAWTTQFSWAEQSLEEQLADMARVLGLVPAVMELTRLDPTGHEQLQVSRMTASRVGSNLDLSQDPKFSQAKANQVYYGPVYFRQGTEPYMTLAIGARGPDAGVTIAEISLKYIWDVVSSIEVGEHGATYVVDADGKLIAHPELSLVLRNTDLSDLAQVRAARSLQSSEQLKQAYLGEDLSGRRVIRANAAIPPLGWLVFVELPVQEAFAPIYASIQRSGAILFAALALAAFAGLYLARRMIIPIRTLRDGAAQIGSGNLAQRINIKTGDELEALGDQFNSMAAELQDSYATLERKVEERTQQLALANLAKSRFLASASHDLRQPLHALGLFIAQLRTRMSVDERTRVVDRVDAALAAMNELFDALLDISKLDSGVMSSNRRAFPVAQLLKRIEATFAGAAREKGLSLRAVSSSAWIHSDFILLERILFNLVSNAVRYTTRGGVVVGCRRRDTALRIEVWDTGPGIPPGERRNIFSEFYRLGGSDRDRRAGGLGLGLAIVDRLCRLLDHPIELASTVGKGSRFSVAVPLVTGQTEIAVQAVPASAPLDISSKLIVVIDDASLVREGMAGLFRSWGCRVVTGDTDGAALIGLREHECPPDLIISDFRLSGGKSGIEIIKRLRSEFCAEIPAFLISGDTNAEPLREARASGLHLLHKPVNPMALRAMLGQVLRKGRDSGVQ